MAMYEQWVNLEDSRQFASWCKQIRHRKMKVIPSNYHGPIWYRSTKIPPSMRQKAVQNKEIRLELENQAEKWQKAVGLIKVTKFTYSEMVVMSAVPLTTMVLLKSLLDTDNTEQLNAMPSTKERRGWKPAISDSESTMVNERLKFAASRGFAVDIDIFWNALSSIAAGSRKGWKNVMPSDDAIRSYRARNCDISYIRHCNKEAAKLNAEWSKHKNWCDATNRRATPWFYSRPNKLWNLN